MAFLIFIPLMYYYGCGFTLRAIILIPVSLSLTCLSTFGLGTLLAAANVKYRDFRYILPFFIQALFFATPVIYPIKISDNHLFQLLMHLNPMSAPIELFRHSFSNFPLDFQGLFISVGASFILFFSGIYYFRKTEAYFADLA